MRRRALLASSSLLAASCLPAAPSGRLRVPFWFSYGGRNRVTLGKLVARFNARQSDVWVEATYQGDYFEGLAKLRTALAAGLAPPLSHVVGEVVPYLESAGVLEPLESYARLGPELDIVPELGQGAAFVGGTKRRLVALPFNRSTPIAYLNRRRFAEHGLSPPTTWAELERVAAALSSPSGRFGFACPIDWWFWAALVGQAGGDLADERGRITLGGDAGLRAVELWQTLVRRGAMKPPPGRDYNAWEQQNQDFLAGRVAMIWSSTAFLRYLEATASFPVDASPLPRGVRAAVPTGGTYFVLLKSAPAELKAAAFRFVRFMLEPGSAAFWSSETGYLPATRGAVSTLTASGHYARYPNDQVALAQLAAARPWPWSKALFRVQREIVQPRLEAILFDGARARATLLEAARLAQKEQA